MAIYFRKFSFILFISFLFLVSTFWISNSRGIYQSSQVLAQTLENRKAEADRLFNQGYDLYEIDQFQLALKTFEQALAIYREIQEISGEARTLNVLGIVYHKFGQYSIALSYYQQALEIAQKIPNEFLLLSEILGNFGNTYRLLGQYEEASDNYLQSLAISQAINDQRTTASTVNNIGLVYRRIEAYEEAIYWHQQALEIGKKLNDYSIQAFALNNLGYDYNQKGDCQIAIPYLEQSLKIKIEKLNQPSRIGNSLENLGNSYLCLGKIEKAITYYQQALSIGKEVNDPLGEAISLANLGDAYTKLKQYKQAEESLLAGINLFESLRSDLSDNSKVAIFDTHAYIYNQLQQTFISQNKTDEALEISERGRARAFVELLSTRLSSNQTEVSPITASKLEEIKQIAKTQNATLVEYSIIVDQLPGNQDTRESELYIWVIQPTGEVTFRRSNLKSFLQNPNISLKDLVTTTRESMGVRGIFDMQVASAVDEKNQSQRLQQLHQILIEPIADLLPNDPKQKIIFVPQGELFLVPFAALQDEKGKYLIEQHTLLTAPSIQVLQLTRQQREKVKQAAVSEALIIGNPTMPSVAPKIGDKPQKLPDLPGAKREAEAIATLFNTKPLTGDAATKSALLARIPQARFIHLATHGLFDDFQGLQSAIALAPTQNDSGLLTAAEILDLKLKAELVVLSACDTGRGRITGDGVIGLSRSLISAGVPSVIVSLWSIPDAPTAELMQEFYRQLAQNGDKAQSLRQAMLKLKEQYPNSPQKWAAFTLIGEAE